MYPAPKNIFRAFDLCPFEKVKVVILGQDPYHGTGQANGLAFAVNDGTRLPPSLQNIYKELATDCGLPFEALAKKGDLAMGKAGSASLECNINRPCAQRWLAPRKRMGTIYRCRYSHTVRKTRTSCVYALG